MLSLCRKLYPVSFSVASMIFVYECSSHSWDAFDVYLYFPFTGKQNSGTVLLNNVTLLFLLT